MKILHLLSGCDSGGIEVLCRNIVRLSKYENHVALLFSGGMIADDMEKNGSTIIRLYNYGRKQRYQKLLELAQKEQYSDIVVHHEGVGTYSYFLYLHKKYKSAKYIKYLHMSYEEKYMFTGSKLQNILHKYLLGKTIKAADTLIAVSEFVKKSYVSKYPIADTKTIVIYNGTELSNITGNELNDSINSKENIPVRLLYVGRLTEVKGIIYLLEAVKSLVDNNIKTELTLVGNGDKRDYYESYVRENGLQEFIHFEGVQNDVSAYYRSHDLFIYPSIWNEAFGISIIEAMSYGMVCIASSVGGIPEIIEDGRDGFLVNPGDSKAIEDAVRRYMVLDNKTKMKSSALKKVIKFDIKNTVGETDAIF
ncbi:MAG: glycosyltransferase family 4 protein [Butyrivibrio sp.]|nr:glycosyltransferase family 4 protein [Butyrivibrio sp.]